MIGMTEVEAEKALDHVLERGSEAKGRLELMRLHVTDSSEYADAIDEALAAIGRAETVAEEVLQRRVNEP